MEHEFIAGIDTWGSGGEMFDVLTLKDGKVLVITEDTVAVYQSRDAFDSGSQHALVYQRTFPSASR